VACPPNQVLGFEKSGVVDAAVSLSLSSRSDWHVLPYDNGVAKLGLLPTVPGAVVAKEIYDFLTTLATSCPESAFN
jgi:hypothetical protein